MEEMRWEVSILACRVVGPQHGDSHVGNACDMVRMVKEKYGLVLLTCTIIPKIDAR